MTSRAQYKSYVRQGRVRVRSLSRLVFLLAGGAALSLAVWGLQWQATICLIGLGILGIVLLFEVFTLRHNQRRHNQRADDEAAVAQEADSG